MSQLETYFQQFRQHVVGNSAALETPYGAKPLIYADWIASGRLYEPIERKLCEQFGQMVANTHSESSATGQFMTLAYHKAHEIIKKHVNACPDDVLITSGFGMTSVLAKFQRILGLRIPEQLEKYCDIPKEERPVVFITHMEHHSNHTPWLESTADVVVIPPGEDLLIAPENLEKEIVKYADRKYKIGSFTACSNVTGIETPYHELAAIMHRNGGVCFVDFAASAPYVDIDMHPADPEQRLDAIFFSPHKFLGGPGSSGVLVFHKKLYKNRIPDHPGGGTVNWTNPWGGRSYIADIEVREDGGTPGFLQAIRTALAIQLKEEMNPKLMRRREEELLEIAFDRLPTIPGLHILAGNQHNRLGIISFYIEQVHHNLIVRLLSDRYGIQVRGGCSCAGTYGHYLLAVDQEQSRSITELIDQGDLSLKPGWIRLSIHPLMTNAELEYCIEALREIVENLEEWKSAYDYCVHTNEYACKHKPHLAKEAVEALFGLESWRVGG